MAASRVVFGGLSLFGVVAAAPVPRWASASEPLTVCGRDLVPYVPLTRRDGAVRRKRAAPVPCQAAIVGASWSRDRRIVTQIYGRFGLVGAVRHKCSSGGRLELGALAAARPDPLVRPRVSGLVRPIGTADIAQSDSRPTPEPVCAGATPETCACSRGGPPPCAPGHSRTGGQ